jgi:hypothetical protein
MGNTADTHLADVGDAGMGPIEIADAAVMLIKRSAVGALFK